MTITQALREEHSHHANRLRLAFRLQLFMLKIYKLSTAKNIQYLANYPGFASGGPSDKEVIRLQGKFDSRDNESGIYGEGVVQIIEKPNMRGWLLRISNFKLINPRELSTLWVAIQTVNIEEINFGYSYLCLSALF